MTLAYAIKRLVQVIGLPLGLFKKMNSKWKRIMETSSILFPLIFLTLFGRKQLYRLSLFCGKRCTDNPIRLFHQFLYYLVRYVCVEIKVAPKSFIHVPCGSHAFVSFPEHSPFLFGSLHATAVKHLNVHIAKPFAAHIETQYVAAIRVFECSERHPLRYARQRKTICSKIFNIHSLRNEIKKFLTSAASLLA